jgi:hypothetical protein
VSAVTWSATRFAHPDGRAALDGIDLEAAEGDTGSSPTPAAAGSVAGSP